MRATKQLCWLTRDSYVWSMSVPNSSLDGIAMWYVELSAVLCVDQCIRCMHLLQDGTNEDDYLRAAVETADKHVVVAGFTSGSWSVSSDGSNDIVAAKLNVDNGEVIWRYQVVVPQSNGARNISPICLRCTIPQSSSHESCTKGKRFWSPGQAARVLQHSSVPRG